MERKIVLGSLLVILFLSFFYCSAYSASSDPCCPLHEELRYLLNPPSGARFTYQVRHEVFFASSLGKEKNFFLILPPDFNPHSSERYPLLIS